MTSLEIAKNYVAEGWELRPADEPEGYYWTEPEPFPVGAEWFSASELNPEYYFLDGGDRYIGVLDGQVVADLISG